MGAQPDPLAQRLADIRGRLEHPPGVMLGVLRLPILDPILEDLEAAATLRAGGPAPHLGADVVRELELTIDVLSTEMLGESPETVGRRARLVEVLRRATDGRLPSRAFDAGDAFGDELRAMLATDKELAGSLGALHPLLIRATAVAPTARWVAGARAFVGERDPEPLISATRRTLASLIRAEIVSRPDLLVGGLRPPNQRLARGLVWFAAAVIATPAELLGAVGLRMGTSGRRDAVVRDTAVANTCAALLGASPDPGAAAALASMRVKVVNRNVLKQVDRALAEIALRAGVPVEAIIEEALPAHGLDERGRLEVEVGDGRAILELAGDGGVGVRWRTADGREHSAAPAELAAAAPGEVASAREQVEAIESAVAEERRRMEARLAAERSWPEEAWRRQFVSHPIGGHFGRRLIWVIGAGSGATAALPVADGWVGVGGRPLPVDTGAEPRSVRLWHPVEADPVEVSAWRAGLAAAGIEQPVRQADREIFRPTDRDRDLAADRRVAGRVVNHSQLRTLLRERGWAVPALGSWDQGDEATAWRVFDDGLRAELRYQAVERLPTGARHERARLVAVRFLHVAGEAGSTGSAGPARSATPEPSPVPLSAVPPRVFSEAMRDVSLVVSVGEIPPTA